MAGDWFDNPEEQRKRNTVYQQSGRPGLFAYDMVKGTGEGSRKIGRGISGIGNWVAQKYQPVGQASSNFFAGAGAALNGVQENKPAIPAAQQEETAVDKPATAPQPAGDVQKQMAGFTTETRRLGGVDANVTTDANGRVVEVRSGNPANQEEGAGWIKLVDPNAKASGLPTGEQLAQYQQQQAAMRRYGNIMRPNGESDRDFNAGSRVVVTPGRGRATNNPGYTFDGNAGDAARFFQSVPNGGGYNPYKQRFRTLFDEQMDARARQREMNAMNEGRPNRDDYKDRTWQTA